MTSPYHFGCICIEWGVVAGVQSYCIFQSFQVFIFFFRLFIDKPTAQTARHISVGNGSNNVVSCKVGPFGVQINIINNFGVHFPQKPSFLAHFWQIVPVRELRVRTAIQTKTVNQFFCSLTQIISYDLRYDQPKIFFRFSN